LLLAASVISATAQTPPEAGNILSSEVRMRQASIAMAFSIALLSVTCVHAETEGVPKRKPGYWEITTVAPVSGMTKTKVCVGEEDDIVRPEGGDCTEPKLTPLNEGVIVDVVCTSKEGKQTISTTFIGDFESRYHAVLKTTFDPPVGAIRNMGFNLDGKYLGPCPESADGQ
jgi:Protein of unknown function (DUF3617)